MSITRNNHYVPQWYQAGFFETGRKTLAYLDLTPDQKTLSDGRIITQRALFDAPTSRAFRQTDLYSTFFGTSVNDEIERHLFGDIDTRGSNAVRAFLSDNVRECHEHFQTLFEYIDTQKIRTPKGLDWLRAQYPELTQNELMFEMQGVRMLHCTIWTEGIREIVSAEDADVKFIVSDHPVTVYNHAVSPSIKAHVHLSDPSISLKASQTLFPLNKNFCLILTNLEYARDPSTAPLEKRTFARNFRSSMVRTDAFIRTRKLSDQEVSRVNYVIKAQARRYIAAGRKEWLYPESQLTGSWFDIRQTLLPPKDGLWHFGGEMFAKFSDGHVRYQDEFGRTEKEREFLKKPKPANALRSRDSCGCGSGRTFGVCCEPRPIELRPAWGEQSIRERNLMFFNAILNVLDLYKATDWVKVRRELTDDKISKIYSLFEGLWPLETDLLNLLPKPDGRPRAIYTGSIHPSTIGEFAFAAPLYFGELLVEHPFVHAGILKKDFNPVANPRIFRQEFLKSVFLFMNVMPLVESGLINLVPDPCNFDHHLRDQMHRMAKHRASGFNIDTEQEPRLKELMREDVQRSMMALPPDALRSILSKNPPDAAGPSVDEMLRWIERQKENDPIAVLQAGDAAVGEKNGQLSMMKLAPNFEITMYLAQAVGASIVTDSRFRWTELLRAARPRGASAERVLTPLSRQISSSHFGFPQGTEYINDLGFSDSFNSLSGTIGEAFRYLSRFAERGSKPNVEARLAAQFAKQQIPAQGLLRKNSVPIKDGRITALFPAQGIQDHTINRLLLMSSSEHHMSKVPMAFYIDRRRRDTTT